MEQYYCFTSHFPEVKEKYFDIENNQHSQLRAHDKFTWQIKSVKIFSEHDLLKDVKRITKIRFRSLLIISVKFRTIKQLSHMDSNSRSVTVGFCDHGKAAWNYRQGGLNNQFTWWKKGCRTGCSETDRQSVNVDDVDADYLFGPFDGDLHADSVSSKGGTNSIPAWSQFFFYYANIVEHGDWSANLLDFLPWSPRGDDSTCSLSNFLNIELKRPGIIWTFHHSSWIRWKEDCSTMEKDIGMSWSSLNSVCCLDLTEKKHNHKDINATRTTRWLKNKWTGTQSQAQWCYRMTVCNCTYLAL